MKTLLALLTATVVISASFAATAAQPNIVLIFADDLSWKDVGYQSTDFTRAAFTRAAFSTRGGPKTNVLSVCPCLKLIK